MTGDEERVLVVDDEEGVRDLLKRALEEAGYNVVTAGNGQEALDKVSQLNISTVLLDIKMPGMSGVEVLQNLTSANPDACIVMVTAVGDAQTAVDTIKMGAYDYITKPFDLEDVILKVQSAIKKRDLHSGNEQHRLQLEEKISEQAEQLQQQFVELVETLSREHKLLYKLAYQQQKDTRSFLSKLPPELQAPMSSVEEFSDALLRILRRTR